MANCKAAGADLVQDCWFKKLTPIHIRWQEYQEDCVCQGNIPEWIVTGRTVLMQKYPAKGSHASNYRPEACLPMMWKLLTGIMGEQLHQHLYRNGLLVDEAEGLKNPRNKGPIACRQNSLEELPKEANKLINGLDRLEEGFR